MLDLAIQHGTVVTAADTFNADIGIKDGLIVQLGQNLVAEKNIDAKGMYVLPGGIDPHVHLEYPQGRFQVFSSDDWTTGTIAAAYGGTTTVIDFVEASPDETLLQAYEKRRQQAESQALIDFGLHMTLNRADDVTLGELPELISAGLTSFKIYLAYDNIRLKDDEFLIALKTLKEQSGLPIIHAENHAIIMFSTAQLQKAGRLEARWHPYSRPVLGEAEATERALDCSALFDLPMHIVHVSSGVGLEAIRRHQQAGRRVTGEACIQHLLLTEEKYEQASSEAAKYVMAPPLRSAADNAALWAGLADNSLAFIVTDHCPFYSQQKSGQRRRPAWRRLPAGITPLPPEEPWSTEFPPFYAIPGGAPGIELRLPLAYHFGVNSGRLSLPQFVNLTSTAAAKRYGLYPRKGNLTPGADADIVIFDPRREVIVRSQDLHENCDYTPYEGMQLLGYPHTVISRGQIIIEGGCLKANTGRGRYLARNRCWE